MKFSEIIEKLQQDNTKMVVSVACAGDEDVLKALEKARSEGLINAILVDEKKKIEEVASKLGVDLSNYEIVDAANEQEAAFKAVQLIREKKADMIMKGMIQTATYLRAILNKETGLRSGKLISHVAFFEVETLGRTICVTDAAMNVAPTLEEKVEIVKNAVLATTAFGIKEPKVALLGAVEVVNPSMEATLHAAAIAKMADRGQIKGAIVDGPFALDNAISKEAAEHKKIKSPVAGQADILVAPDIEAGNILYKSLGFIAKAKAGAILVGAKVPAILTSRADSDENKHLSIVTAAWVAKNSK